MPIFSKEKKITAKKRATRGVGNPSKEQARGVGGSRGRERKNGGKEKNPKHKKGRSRIAVNHNRKISPT